MIQYLPCCSYIFSVLATGYSMPIHPANDPLNGILEYMFSVLVTKQGTYFRPVMMYSPRAAKA